jgi:hypothetical protein
VTLAVGTTDEADIGERERGTVQRLTDFDQPSSEIPVEPALAPQLRGRCGGGAHRLGDPIQALLTDTRVRRSVAADDATVPNTRLGL